MNKNLNLKYGDKVTYKSKLDNRLTTLYVDGYDGYTIERFEGKNREVLKVERPTNYKTIYEVKEVLDKKEKEYLSYVIRPFRNKIKHIIKLNDNQEWLMIRLNDDEPITFPYFEANTMYKGMKEGKEYTLEELGL